MCDVSTSSGEVLKENERASRETRRDPRSLTSASNCCVSVVGGDGVVVPSTASSRSMFDESPENAAALRKLRCCADEDVGDDDVRRSGRGGRPIGGLSISAVVGDDAIIVVQLPVSGCWERGCLCRLGWVRAGGGLRVGSSYKATILNLQYLYY